MASDLKRICGMWARDTKRGKVISVALTQAIADQLVAVIQGSPNGELVLFENDRRDKDSSPTHNLCVGVGKGARTPQEPRAATGMPEQAETGERRAPAQRQAGTGGFGDDFIRNPAPKRELDADDIPF